MAKDEAASALARKRWKGTTKAERSKVAADLNKSRWANATEEERAEHGRMLAAARAKKKEAQSPTSTRKK